MMRRFVWSFLLMGVVSVTAFSQSKKGMENNKEKATFGGGCFWCTEAIFERIEGVTSVMSGYSGGQIKNPTYREVSSGATGHAEVIQITYDPAKVSYYTLLEVFFKTHDPTTLNRQGADVGTQYRSIILYHTEEQKEKASEIIRELNDQDIWKNPIVTEIVPFESFYQAEDYHQNYYDNNSNQGYCRMVITPKIEKLEEIFEDKLKQ